MENSKIIKSLNILIKLVVSILLILELVVLFSKVYFLATEGFSEGMLQTKSLDNTNTIIEIILLFTVFIFNAILLVKIKNKVIIESFNKKNKVIITIVSIFIVLSIIGIFSFDTIRPLSEVENKVISDIKDYKSRLKDPDSLKIYEVRYQKTSEGDFEVYFDCTGQNSYGGASRAVVKYVNGKFYGNTENVDGNISKYNKDSQNLAIATADLVKEDWNKVSKKDETKVNLNKIKSNLK
jgi:hypothetical protein